MECLIQKTKPAYCQYRDESRTGQSGLDLDADLLQAAGREAHSPDRGWIHMNGYTDYIFSNDFYRTVDVMVASTGHEKCEPSHSYGPAVRSTWLFHYVHAGKGTFQIDGKTYALQAGDLFLMPPGVRIFYQADAEDPWEYSWLGLQGMKVEEYIRRTRLANDHVVHLPQNSRIPRIFARLEETAGLQNSDLAYNACAYEFLYDLSLEIPVPVTRTVLQPEDYAEMVVQYVEQNFDRPITVQEIADRLALDRSYVHKVFKKKMNMSVKDYILSLRLANACSFLAYTDLPVSDISRSVGYEDTLYFSRLFHRKKGCSPTEYRRLKKEETRKKDLAARQEAAQPTEPDTEQPE